MNLAELLPAGIAISPDGAYGLIADQSSHQIRKLLFSTVSGTSLVGFAGTFGLMNGIGTNAKFYNRQDLKRRVAGPHTTRRVGETRERKRRQGEE
jgi:hypothetical protein